MKKLICLVAIMLLLSSYAYPSDELKAKIGYSSIMCDGIGSSPVLGVSVEKRNSWIGVELGDTLFFPNIYSVGQFIGNDVSLTLKGYYKEWYLGGGVGYCFNGMLYNSYHSNLSNKPKTTIENEFTRHLVAGKNFSNGYFVEIKRYISDLNVETGIIDYEPVIEKRSRYDAWMISLGKKF